MNDLTKDDAPIAYTLLIGFGAGIGFLFGTLFGWTGLLIVSTGAIIYKLLKKKGESDDRISYGTSNIITVNS